MASEPASSHLKDHHRRGNVRSIALLRATLAKGDVAAEAAGVAEVLVHAVLRELLARERLALDQVARAHLGGALRLGLLARRGALRPALRAVAVVRVLRLLEQPKTPATAGRTTTALKQYADLVQMSARCGVEVARYSYLKGPVRTLVKLAESEERDEKGDDLKEARRALERKHNIGGLMVGKDARAAFLRYVDDLRDDVRRLIKQEEVGAPDKSGDIAPRRGAGRRARGAHRD